MNGTDGVLGFVSMREKGRKPPMSVYGLARKRKIIYNGIRKEKESSKQDDIQTN
jgi:hypothetical protein